MDRITRQIGINPQGTLLHAVGHCGIKPADEAELLSQGYELVELVAEGDVATFTYERGSQDGTDVA